MRPERVTLTLLAASVLLLALSLVNCAPGPRPPIERSQITARGRDLSTLALDGCEIVVRPRSYPALVFDDLARSLADLPAALQELVRSRARPERAPVPVTSGPGWTLTLGEAIAWLESLKPESADAIVTDPPYSSGGQFRGDRAAKPSLKYQTTGTVTKYPEFVGDSRDGRTWGLWSERWMAAALRVARDGAPICVFTDWRQLSATIDAMGLAGWIYRGVVPWDKTQGVRPQPGRFRSQAEFVVWGSKGHMPLDRRVLSQAGTSALPGALPAPEDPVELAGYVTEVVRSREKRHVTAKPIRVLDAIVRICEPDGLILDPFAGSCTTGVAALRLGYRFAGCEMVPEIHAIGSAMLREVAA